MSPWFRTVLLIALLLPKTALSADPSCKPGPELKTSEILLGYVHQPARISEKTGLFNALAVLEHKTLRPTDGAMIRDGMRFIFPLEANRRPVALAQTSAYLERLGRDHCVYHARFQDTNLADWTLVSTAPVNLRIPSPTDRTRFYELETHCVQQGDYGPGEGPPCVKPILVAVSDIDGDLNPEYWHTSPFIWDTGFAVSEEANTVLEALVYACPGCSEGNGLFLKK